ncbi:Reverse transcriptase (RNA-dependent DNA polymerase) [Clavibacter michiganensis]|nr:Reverse transcriptase (RNA-dependent DNA polymerase) [Clavibacter michiganensis]
MSPDLLVANLGKECELISRRLRSGNYTFTPYKQLLKSKGANKVPRVISIPTARDRIALRALAEVLKGSFELTHLEPAPFKVSKLKAVLASEAHSAYVRVDIKDFYPSISQRTLMQSLRTRIRKPEILSALQSACSTPTVGARAKSPTSRSWEGVPQGLSISNLLAEINMLSVDAAFVGDNEVSYFRYVDDIIILCNESQQDAIDTRIRRALLNVDLTAHPVGDKSKSHLGLIADGFEYLGFKFTSSSVSIRDSSVHNIEHSLARTFTAYKYAVRKNPPRGFTDATWRDQCLNVLQWRLNLLITGCIIDQSRRGWLGFFSRMDDRALLKRLDTQVRRLVRRHDVVQEIQPKLFTSTFWAINQPSERRMAYIPNYDIMGADEMRRTLRLIFGIDLPPATQTEDVRARLKMCMQGLLRELARDIGGTS